jgi:Zn-dependent alcohol dehydrogenase
MVFSSLHQVIKDMTNGGADYCFECIGLASLMEEAFNSSREVCSLYFKIKHALFPLF